MFVRHREASCQIHMLCRMASAHACLQICLQSTRLCLIQQGVISRQIHMLCRMASAHACLQICLQSTRLCLIWQGVVLPKPIYLVARLRHMRACRKAPRYTGFGLTGVYKLHNFCAKTKWFTSLTLQLPCVRMTRGSKHEVVLCTKIQTETIGTK